MAGNGRMGSGRSGGASISAAATAFGSSETRFPLEERVCEAYSSRSLPLLL